MEPAGHIAPPDWMTVPATGRVLAVLAGAGTIGRFVGGCVRDAVLGRPVKDIDIATPAPPEAVLQWLEAGGLRAIPTGLAHGTVTAVSDGWHFEITTLRRDVETFGRHARVEFTDDWAADAARRDLTMNALFADPDGTLYDPTGGLADLAAGRVRFVGDPAERIAEDALRLLRFFRFYAHYGRSAPDPAAVAACRAAAASLARLSGERIAGELLRLLAADSAARVLCLMQEEAVLPQVVPDAAGFDRLARLIAIEAELGECVPLRRLAALLIGRPQAVERLADRLRLSNAETARLTAAVAPLDLDPASPPPTVRQALYRLGHERLRDRLLLGWAGDEAHGGWPALLHQVESMPRPEFPLQGRDALALGAAPGPAIGRALAEVERWWAAGDFRAGRDEALAELRARLPG